MKKSKVIKHSITAKDIKEGKQLNDLFENLSEEGKIMATVYISALRDKESLEKKTG